MTETERNGTTANKYDTENPYDETDSANTGPSKRSTMSSVMVRQGDTWQARNVPAAPTYQPILGETRRGRRRAEKLIEDFGTATAVANAGERFNQALNGLEKSAQEKEETQERRRLIPLKIEQQKFVLGQDLVKAQTDFVAALDQQQDDQVDRDRRRRLNIDNYQNIRLRKEAERLELQARIDAASAERAYAPKIGKLRAEAELHKAEEEAFRAEASAGAERRRRDQGRQATESEGDMPPDLRAPLATAQRVAQTREWVDRKIAEIKRRALDAGRDLAPDEIERIDELQDAAASGEASIRRNGASDVA